jgi:NAD(P)H dehydrogenase (quinone)
MKHAVIFAHPKKKSFTATVAATYAAAVGELGHEAVVRDLYGVGFDPCLKAEEIPTARGYWTAPDVVAERKVIDGADVFVFVYPFWFNAPPAILKGYVDRVFGMGFGYEPGHGGTWPLLEGRRLISFSSSGAPDQWVQQTGALTTLMQQFDRHVAAVCGLVVADHVHFSGMSQQVTEDWVERMLADVRAAARKVAQAEMALP